MGEGTIVCTEDGKEVKLNSKIFFEKLQIFVFVLLNVFLGWSISNCSQTSYHTNMSFESIYVVYIAWLASYCIRTVWKNKVSLKIYIFIFVSSNWNLIIIIFFTFIYFILYSDWFVLNRCWNYRCKLVSLPHSCLQSFLLGSLLNLIIFIFIII